MKAVELLLPVLKFIIYVLSIIALMLLCWLLFTKIHSSTPLSGNDSAKSHTHENKNQHTFTDVLEKPRKAVVALFTSHVPTSNNHYHKPLHTRHEHVNIGSGVVISDDGYIVTNEHVITHKDKIVVMFDNGEKVLAKFIARDRDSDLAVIKIDRENLNFLPLEKHNNTVGETVYAIGNPYGLGQTVTKGIVSALQRAGVHRLNGQTYIQTDAAINVGNSGGALINARGELIGINTAIFSARQSARGLAFSIPSENVKRVTDDLINLGYVDRGWLGVHSKLFTAAVHNHSQDSDQTSAAKIDTTTNTTDKTLDTHEVLVVKDMLFQSPAYNAGIKYDDIILSVDGIPVKTPAQLKNIIRKYKAETKIVIRVCRNRKIQDIEVTLKRAPFRDYYPED